MDFPWAHRNHYNYCCFESQHWWWLSMGSPKPLLLLMFWVITLMMAVRGLTETIVFTVSNQQKHVWRQWTLDARVTRGGKLFSKIGLATERISRHWSVVSCVRCGCVGAGLEFPVGAPSVFHPQPPISLYVWQKAAWGHSLTSSIVNINLYMWQKGCLRT